ncbi:J domain-containing protein required for chloroplast accumulation response 1-like isoform X2 [Camellia sinensis]|uniref:J domain-containing protein required for chloroplast accumulation response 1-like isoform X2 n=1 Tax=Camellia sinensis TaxID=4442 RepID=UPI001035813B|nr:J domain-containing protein required for chloroplast accumulation response 1-like isoform X2 [Camellia sinensis]
MERFSQRENILLGYSPQRALAYHNYSPKKRSQHSAIDFHDVFGGPLRRSSKQEMSYSFCETMNSSKNSIGVGEMPVFGEETVNRRRYPSDDFFDDIFKGDESLSSPRRSDRDPFGSSSPGSRVLSTACPLPPAQFQFSLPSKLTKATDVPAFASNNHSPYKYKDPTSNGVSSPLPRLSSEAFKEEDQLRNEIHSSNRHSPLSHEYSLSTKEPSYMTKSDALESADTGGDMKKDLKSTEAPSNSSQFHFSIYRWASKGVPLLMPRRRGYSPKSKEKVKTERCLSSNGRIESDNMASGLSANESPNTEGRNQDESLCLKTSIEDRVEPFHIALEAVLSMPGSKFINNIPDIVETVTDDAISSDKREDIKPPHSVSDIGLCANTEKQVDMSMHEVQKSELKPLRSFLIEEQGNGEITRKSEAKDRIVKETTVSHSNARVSKNVKKRDEKRIHSNRAEVIQVNEPLSQGAGRTSGDNIGRNGLGGKVKEFVKIFNQEGTSKPKIDTETRRWRGTGTDTCGADNEGSANTTQTNGKKHVHNANKVKTPPNASIMVDKNLAGSEKQQSHTKTTVFCVSDNSFGQKDASKASSESSPDGSKVTVGNIDDLFQENFMIKELSNDEDKPPNIGEDYEDIHISDAKIWQWSNGKEGNIRSLLSTLQFVLWPGSGWKPVPLVDIIEGSAVKRAYQKALLCLHPDKLQQKGVASHQKYIAEKVFDILQEAWDQFNSLSAI